MQARWEWTSGGRARAEAVSDARNDDDDDGRLFECVVTIINVLRSSRGVSLSFSKRWGERREKHLGEDGRGACYAADFSALIVIIIEP